MANPENITMLYDATWEANSAFRTIEELLAAEDWGTKQVLPLESATTLLSELLTHAKLSTGAIASFSLRLWEVS